MSSPGKTVLVVSLAIAGTFVGLMSIPVIFIGSIYVSGKIEPNIDAQEVATFATEFNTQVTGKMREFGQFIGPDPVFTGDAEYEQTALYPMWITHMKTIIPAESFAPGSKVRVALDEFAEERANAAELEKEFDRRLAELNARLDADFGDLPDSELPDFVYRMDPADAALGDAPLGVQLRGCGPYGGGDPAHAPAYVHKWCDFNNTYRTSNSADYVVQDAVGEAAGGLGSMIEVRRAGDEEYPSATCWVTPKSEAGVRSVELDCDY